MLLHQRLQTRKWQDTTVSLGARVRRFHHVHWSELSGKLTCHQDIKADKPGSYTAYSLLLWMSLHIFGILLITNNICVLNFYQLAAWDGCWSLISIWRFIYKCLKVCPFDCIAVAGSGNIGPLILRLTTLTVVALTDRPKSVHTHFVIEQFCSVYVLL